VGEAGVFFLSAAISLLSAAVVWALYLAFEPYVRRRWPQSMVSWSRVLSGGFRDPLVGGHALFGLALEVGFALLNSGYGLALQYYGTITTSNNQLLSLLDTRRLTSILVNDVFARLLFMMSSTFILMLLRVLLAAAMARGSRIRTFLGLAGVRERPPRDRGYLPVNLV
jgi:hypothetical protein